MSSIFRLFFYIDNGLSGDLEVSEGDEDENDEDDENCKQNTLSVWYFLVWK